MAGREMVTRDVGQICLVCAWRENCAKRFTIGDDATLHCPDFSRDVSLDKAIKEQQNDKESEGN
jgi:hypothetical protein